MKLDEHVSVTGLFKGFFDFNKVLKVRSTSKEKMKHVATHGLKKFSKHTLHYVI
jgi:hypothetical protein